jgi:hypothetical protein
MRLRIFVATGQPRLPLQFTLFGIPNPDTSVLQDCFVPFAYETKHARKTRTILSLQKKTFSEDAAGGHKAFTFPLEHALRMHENRECRAIACQRAARRNHFRSSRLTRFQARHEVPQDCFVP